MASEIFHWPLVSIFFLSKLEENLFGKSDRPKCNTNVEMIKLSKKNSGKESETNG